MNTNIGSEQGSMHNYPNGASSTSGTSQAGRGTSGASGSVQTGGQMDSVIQTAQRVGSQMMKSPYSLPIAIGGAAFVLGALASSRILRQLVFFGCAYAVKYAVANAPKDQIADYAKNFIKASFSQQQSA